MVEFYSSNLTRAQFDLIQPLLPAAKPGGCPRSTSLWALLNAIFYVVTQGCKWRDSPGDLPAWQTVSTYCRHWRKDGTWQAMHARLRAWIRAAVGRPDSPSEVILDRQTVPTVAMVQQAVVFDRFKATKGRKRHTAVETLGLVMTVRVTAASLPEREGGKRVLQRLSDLGAKVCRLYLVWVDGGYTGQPLLQWVMDRLR
jgi:putative transposase